ncbi:MAG TPA: PQQ-binding-like beta-propeller repeat protein [Thermoanaerobaculia bacterium]|nr:PQQ-binding-like beta-propeller repeat protein [Thermoanaerobaculia bacterium]
MFKLSPRPAAALALILSTSAVLVAAAPAASPEWPHWRGPNRDAVAQESGLLTKWPESGPPLAWKASGLGGGFSSLSISGGRVYTLGDRQGSQQVVAMSLADGKIAWTAKVGPIWEDEYGGPRGTPTVDGDRVYALGTDGDLVCLQAATGKEVWRKNLARDFGGRVMSSWKWAESPLVDGDRLIVTPGAAGATLAALDKKTGKEIWRAAVPSLGDKGRDGAGYSSVMISNGAGVKQYVQLTGRGLVSVRAQDGKFLWGYNKVANDVANIPTPVVKDDYIFASTGYQTGSALLKLSRSGEGVQAQEVYFLSSKTLQNHHGGLVLVGGHLYGGHGHNRGYPICVEMASGKVAWGGEGGDVSHGGTGSAAVTAADGHLYFRYQNGRVVLIEAKPQGYQVKGAFSVPDVHNPSWSHPVVAGGKLYLREQDNLYVYDLKAKPA